MTEQNRPYYYDEVIDLREMINTLLKYKWLILAATMAIVLIAFVFSKFLIPPRYQTSAYVSVIEPTISADLESRIQVSPTYPDISSLAELAESQSVRDQVRSSVNVTNNDLLIQKMTASVQGDQQLQLQVVANESELAARTANVWAQTMVHRVGEIYGADENTLALLRSKVQNAKEEWDGAQEALESYLPESKVESKEVQLAVAKSELKIYLQAIEQNRLLMSDARTLLGQLKDENPDDKLQTGFILSIIGLQQRVVGSAGGTQVHVQLDEGAGQVSPFENERNEISTIVVEQDQIVTESPDITLSEFPDQGNTVSAGRKTLQSMIDTLIDQNNEFEQKIPQLEEQISQVSFTLETERYEQEQLTFKRNLARNTYIALANQLEESKIVQSHLELSVKISTGAAVPSDPAGPRVRIYVGLSSVLGFILSTSIVYIYDWWKRE